MTLAFPLLVKTLSPCVRSLLHQVSAQRLVLRPTTHSASFLKVVVAGNHSNARDTTPHGGCTGTTLNITLRGSTLSKFLCPGIMGLIRPSVQVGTCIRAGRGESLCPEGGGGGGRGPGIVGSKAIGLE